MSKPTPGPWQYSPGNCYWDKLGKMYTAEMIYSPEGNWIAAILREQDLERLIAGEGISLQEAKANAQLIAVAPELLAICEEFVRKVECGEARSTRTYNQMKAVLAKVKRG